MKFAELLDPETPQIEAYDAEHFQIGGLRFNHSVLLLPDAPVRPWDPQPPRRLEAADLAPLLAAQPQLILLGTGRQQRMPDPEIMGRAFEQGIGLEWMSTGAACRTYNLLVSEGRRVAAGILLDRELP